MKNIEREILLDSELFGNDAGEDEDIERLNDYFLIKPQHKEFFMKSRKLSFVRARKGVGKSALLCYTASKVEKEYPNDIVINIRASELVSILGEKTNASYGYEIMWQQRICSRINNEIGKRIKIAVSDDSMSIVETSEITGFKGKNIIKALLDRIKNKSGNIEIKESTIVNDYEILKRYRDSKAKDTVWLLVDDIDATFIDSPENRLLISTFFSACRSLTQSIKELNIRASIRTDVWSMICNDEAMDKCEQYIIDLKWSTKDTGDILKNKIKTYFRENHEVVSYVKNKSDVIENIFINNFRWGHLHVTPYQVIHIFSAGRPRWAAQLCRIAAKDAYNKKSPFIGFGNITYAMAEYGRFRLSDLQKEHDHQCNRLAEIVESFRNKSKEYRLSQLRKHVEDNILNVLSDIQIDNVKISQPIDIVKFLYRIGFITLRNDEYDNARGFTRFEDAPDLLGPTNTNEEDLWIIHPAYRNILGLK